MQISTGSNVTVKSHLTIGEGHLWNPVGGESQISALICDSHDHTLPAISGVRLQVNKDSDAGTRDEAKSFVSHSRLEQKDID